MNDFTDRGKQRFDGMALEGKGDRIMTTNYATETQTTSFATSRTRRPNRVSRGRWLRLMAVLAGMFLIVMQAAPVLAAGSSISRSALEDLDYRSGKEESLYGLGGAQFAPTFSSLTALAPQAGISFNAPDPAGKTSSTSIDILEDAAEKLKASQQPDDAEEVEETEDVEQVDETDETDERERDNAPTVEEEPAGDVSGESKSSLAEYDFEIAVTDDFTSGSNTVLWTGEYEGNEGFISEEDGGWYVMLIQPGTAFPLIATGQMTITDGAIVTGASFGGDGVGEVGLVGRSAIDNSAYYYCSADSYGGAGCRYFDGAQWYDLLYLAPGEVTRYDVDLLDMEIIGDTLTFYVNDTLVGSVTGAGIDGGSWGVSTVCFEGDCAGSFDFVDVYDYSGAADSGSDNDTGLTTYLASDMSSNDLGLYVDEGEWGFADVYDGWYVVEMAPAWYFPNAIPGTETLSDGVITMEAAFEGYGAIGLVTRMTVSEDGYSSYYVCWLASEGYANCNVVVDDTWYEIEGAMGVEVPVQDVNQLTMGVFGDQVIFAANGQPVVDAFDGTLTSGAMGFYHEAYGDASESTISYIDSVTIEVVGTDETVDGDVQNVFASELDENDIDLYVDAGEWGATSFVDGWYATEMVPGWWFPNSIAGTDTVQDGYITSVVSLDGYGAAGLVARSQYTEGAGSSYYVCWINTDAYAGCHLVFEDQWTPLFVTEQPIALQDVNELSLGVFGAEIYFMVNGEMVIETYDETLTSGHWGLYTEAYEGADGATSYVDFVALDQYIGS